MGKIGKADFGFTMLAQHLGRPAGQSFSLKLLFDPPTLGETGFAVLGWQALGIEFLATFLLMFVIMSVAEAAVLPPSWPGWPSGLRSRWGPFGPAPSPALR